MSWSAGPQCNKGESVLARVGAVNRGRGRVILNKLHLIVKHGSSKWQIVQAAPTGIEFF